MTSDLFTEVLKWRQEVNLVGWQAEPSLKQRKFRMYQQQQPIRTNMNTDFSPELVLFMSISCFMQILHQSLANPFRVDRI